MKETERSAFGNCSYHADQRKRETLRDVALLAHKIIRDAETPEVLLAAMEGLEKANKMLKEA